MSKTVLILFAACVGLSLLSLHLVKQMRDGDAKIAELQSQISQLQTPVIAPQEEQPAPPPPMVEPEPIPTPAPKETLKAAATIVPAAPVGVQQVGVPAPSAEDRMRMMREHMEHQRQLMQDPEYREAMRAQHRIGMSRQYPGLARELGLTPEETEALFNLLADQQMRASENSPSPWEPADGDPTTSQQRQQKAQQHWQDVQRKNEAELAAHLGSQKMQAWKEYQSTLGARYEVEQLNNSLAGRGLPLDEDANRSVMKALAAMQKAEQQEIAQQTKALGTQGTAVAAIAFGPGMSNLTTGPADQEKFYEKFLEQTRKRNQRMLEAISPYLTHEQREAVQKERDAQLKMQEAQMRIMRARRNAEQQGGNAGAYVEAQQMFVPVQ